MFDLHEWFLSLLFIVILQYKVFMFAERCITIAICDFLQECLPALMVT